MKVKFTLNPSMELSVEDFREVMEGIHENERKAIESFFKTTHDQKANIFLKTVKKAYKQMYKIDLKPITNLEFISPTEAILTVDTGLDDMALSNPILRRAMNFGHYKEYKNYDKISNGRIMTELMLPKACKHKETVTEKDGRVFCKNCRFEIKKSIGDKIRERFTKKDEDAAQENKIRG